MLQVLEAYFGVSVCKACLILTYSDEKRLPILLQLKPQVNTASKIRLNFEQNEDIQILISSLIKKNLFLTETL